MTSMPSAALEKINMYPMESGQISSQPHTTDLPPKGSVLEGKSTYFREIEVGQIL